jgi:hypothetical protein
VPIRRGQESARVEVELDDGMVVERRWSASGTRLEVRTKEGAKYSSPQKVLDGLTGKLTFDPLTFMREKPERQAEILRQLVGVDFTLLDGKRQRLYDDRTEINRRVAAAKARLAALPLAEAPDELVSAADLVQEQERRREQHDANERKREQLARAREQYRVASDAVTAASRRIEELTLQLTLAREDHGAAVKRLDEAQAAGAALRAEVEGLAEPNLDEIPAQLREVEAVNDRVRAKRARADEVRLLAAAEKESAELTASIEEVDAQKQAAIAGAAFPVPGIGFGQAGVTLNDLPLEQASSAEQLRVSVAMGLALNPKLKVLLLRDGSLLDERSLALVAGMAEAASAQVWIEMVSTAGGAGIVIEDGLVEGAAATKDTAA